MRFYDYFVPVEKNDIRRSSEDKFVKSSFDILYVVLEDRIFLKNCSLKEFRDFYKTVKRVYKIKRKGYLY